MIVLSIIFTILLSMLLYYIVISLEIREGEKYLAEKELELQEIDRELKALEDELNNGKR